MHLDDKEMKQQAGRTQEGNDTKYVGENHNPLDSENVFRPCSSVLSLFEEVTHE